jgi:uncharacterized membrane protein
MNKSYNVFAGQSLDRLAALSDGVFAVAMTLLVLQLQVPASGAIHSEHGLVTYLMSFLTLGIFWIGQQTQLNQLTRSNRDLTWIHLGFLLAVTLMPFSTALLADFIAYRIAVVEYWLNILLLGAVLFGSWRYASHAKLVKDEMTVDMRKAVDQRIFLAQALYAFGVLLCVFNTYASIAVLVLVQLNYVIAPRIGPLYRF